MLVAHVLQEVVVGAAVDVVMDALVELDELAHVRCHRDRIEVGDELVDHLEVLLGTPLRCEARREGLELLAHLRQRREIARIERGDEHPAARVDLHEPLVGERAQGLADRRTAQAEPLLELRLAEQGAGGEFEGDDEGPDLPVGEVGLRERLPEDGVHDSGRGHGIDISVRR